MRIGEKVRILREAQRMTLQDLANVVGVHQVTLSQYERGTRPLPYDDIEKFADALGAEVSLFAADEPWGKIEEARRRYDAVIAEVQSILRTSQDPVTPHEEHDTASSREHDLVRSAPRSDGKRAPTPHDIVARSATLALPRPPALSTR